MLIQKNNMRGFTLIEILLVVVIIGILLAISTMPVVRYLKSSRDLRRKADLNQLATALELYRSNDPNSSYPEQLKKDNVYTNIDAYIASTQQPTDPVTKMPYYYNATCISHLCTRYILGANLEITNASNCPNNIGDYNYCLTSDGSAL